MRPRSCAAAGTQTRPAIARIANLERLLCIVLP
jgi:hypothetical protein